MGECIAEEGEPTEDDPGAHERRRHHGDEAADERALHERRLERLGDQVHGIEATEPRTATAAVIRSALVRISSR